MNQSIHNSLFFDLLFSQATLVFLVVLQPGAAMEHEDGQGLQTLFAFSRKERYFRFGIRVIHGLFFFLKSVMIETFSIYRIFQFSNLEQKNPFCTYAELAPAVLPPLAEPRSKKGS